MPALAAVYDNIQQLPSTSYDFIIVGGGTGGSVVANRLSENPTFQVLLIEAGPTNEGVLNSMVPYLAGALQKTIYDWNYTTVPGVGLNNRTLDYPRGHILGGCSSHNNMFYTRGSKDDYDRWAQVTGDPGWSWEKLLPYILKNERWSPPSDGHDTQGDFDPSVHGFSGIMFTSLPSAPQPIDDMILEVTKEQPSEFPYLLDMNAGRPLGLGWYQGSIGNGTRSSSATAYLSSKFTTRRNLHVLLNTKVTKVHPITGSPAPLRFGLVETTANLLLTARREIILSAGPINTPHILMNSGIGDRNALTEIGIRSVLHLPSVGKNLTDQPIAGVSYSVSSNDTLDNLIMNKTLQAIALAQWKLTRTGPYADAGPNFIAWARLADNSSIVRQFGDPSAGPNTPHLELAPFSGSAFFLIPQPGHFVGIASVVVTPASRGSVTLNRLDPLGKPYIDLGYYKSEFDILAMREALKLSQRFFKATVWRKYIIEQVAPPANATSDAELDEYIRSFSFTTNHAVGTAAMSAKNSQYGVVDPDLRVKGTMGLRIVDASVMPYITSAHPQVPVYAISERASDLIKNLWN
ncbi:pyranose dehydrogenase [Pholiota conissans]|uniref:pyranose dehydrogenase (acceptor) n=1 Tax=Pholiota conissans TaxID=109636 RepID=A0A9P5Z8S0_9AGAR|nr:pyranose dehydrogenase [Pholiota conissans]